MSQLEEVATLDGVTFTITQRTDGATSFLLIGMLCLAYAAPVGIIVLLVLLILAVVGMSVGAALAGLLIFTAMGAIAVAVAANIRSERSRQVTLAVRPGVVEVDGESFPLAQADLLLQPMTVSGRAVLVLAADGRTKQLSGLCLSPPEQARLRTLLDTARRDADQRAGGSIPAALHELRGMGPTA